MKQNEDKIWLQIQESQTCCEIISFAQKLDHVKFPDLRHTVYTSVGDKENMLQNIFNFILSSLFINPNINETK